MILMGRPRSTYFLCLCDMPMLRRDPAGRSTASPGASDSTSQLRTIGQALVPSALAFACTSVMQCRKLTAGTTCFCLSTESTGFLSGQCQLRCEPQHMHIQKQTMHRHTAAGSAPAGLTQVLAVLLGYCSCQRVMITPYTAHVAMSCILE